MKYTTLNRGRRKHLWVSTSVDLKNEAARVRVGVGVG